MTLVEIEEFHNHVMKAKENGTPIIKTLKDFGVSKSTYYRNVDENGEDKWRTRCREKMVTKQKRMFKIYKRKKEFTDTTMDEAYNETEKNFGMSGGGPDDNYEKKDFFSGDVGAYIKQGEKNMQKYYDKYNIK